ncbi:hypothetical protein [Breznakia pachnodae]|uniref:Uncharacterized protein n=1 Tax=Breznakia pachnodae TaxID=265178 RepID=A0ABU0E0E1_9FIRM|nr:hypothetical protein [Breznakia pachnodae]MDQ0360285.1 hypothetical protein [Breznakia pachnodae]
MEFIASKSYKDIIEFDERNGNFRFTQGDNNIYSLKDIVRCRKSIEFVGSIMHNMYTTNDTNNTHLFSSKSEDVRIRIKLFFFDGSYTYGYISKENIQRNSLPYKRELETAEAVANLISVIANENREN